MTVLWIATGVLAVLLIALVAGMFLLLAMARMHLDLGWGRSTHTLGPLEVRIAASRALVFELIAAPYLGRASTGPEIDVIARGGDITVAAHYTRVHFYTARAVEVVDFEPPSRIGFRHLTGPVPHAIEFALSESEGSTRLRSTGEIGIDFALIGRIAARQWVRPQWERAVREHLDELKDRAEKRAARRAAPHARTPDPKSAQCEPTWTGAGAQPASGLGSPDGSSSQSSRPRQSRSTQSQSSPSRSSERIVSARAINSSTSASLRLASSCQRFDGDVSGGKPWNSVRISSRLKPARLAKRIAFKSRTASPS